MKPENYNGALTREQFLFHEIRITAGFYLEGRSADEAVSLISEKNLFQYPSERMTANIARACYRRLDAMRDRNLVEQLLSAPVEEAKQINLYAMIRYSRLVWEFMVSVIGEKYRNQDFILTRKDINLFFAQIQVQSETVASWSEATVGKIKSVLIHSLVETGYLDTFKSKVLNPVLIGEALEQSIRASGDLELLPAFNCFR